MGWHHYAQGDDIFFVLKKRNRFKLSDVANATPSSFYRKGGFVAPTLMPSYQNWLALLPTKTQPKRGNYKRQALMASHLHSKWHQDKPARPPR